MNRNKKKGFTLVELLAVIVILAIILVIAVPKIMETIKKAKTGSMESSAKLIAKSLETNYQVSLANGEGGTLSLTGSCLDAKIADIDLNEYESCTYTITDGKAKVTLKGKSTGKFAGLTCKNVTKTTATCTEDTCSNTLTGNAAEVLISQLDNNIGLEKFEYDSNWNEKDSTNYNGTVKYTEYRFTGSGDTYEYTVTDPDECIANFKAEVDATGSNPLIQDDIDTLCTGGKWYSTYSIGDIITMLDIPYENISSYINKTLNTGIVKNYVIFNGETWRIIGIFDSQIKIIRDESIGNLVWNSLGTNTWIGSTMQTYLTGTYYSSLTSTAQNMVNTSATFNIGGVAYSTTVTASEAYIKEKADPNSEMKVGLMTLSDYGFAASRICRDTYYVSYNDGQNDYNNSTCTANNWIHKGIYEWTMTRNLSDSNFDWVIIKYGSSEGKALVQENFSSRPVVYLKSSVQITGGSGTSTDPYTLG